MIVWSYIIIWKHRQSFLTLSHNYSFSPKIYMCILKIVTVTSNEWYDGMWKYSTLATCLAHYLSLSRTTQENMIVCDPYILGRATPQVRNIAPFIFQVFRICLAPSPPRTSPLRGATYWNAIVSLQGSSLRDVCSAMQTYISYVPWGGTMFLMLLRRTQVSYAAERTLFDVIAALAFTVGLHGADSLRQGPHFILCQEPLTSREVISSLRCSFNLRRGTWLLPQGFFGPYY